MVSIKGFGTDSKSVVWGDLCLYFETCREFETSRGQAFVVCVFFLWSGGGVGGILPFIERF